MVEQYGVYYHGFMKHFHVDTAGGYPMFCRRKTTPQPCMVLKNDE